MFSRGALFGAAGVSTVGVGGARHSEASMCNPPALDKVRSEKPARWRLPSNLLDRSQTGCRRRKRACGLSTRAPAAGRTSSTMPMDACCHRRDRHRASERHHARREALWIGSTFSYENVRCDARTGDTIRSPDSRLNHVCHGRRSAATAEPACGQPVGPGPRRTNRCRYAARAAVAGAEQSLAGRARAGVARPDVDHLDVGAIDLSDRSEVMGRAEELPHTGQSPPRPCLQQAVLVAWDSNWPPSSGTTSRADRLWRRFNWPIQIPSRTG